MDEICTCWNDLVVYHGVRMEEDGFMERRRQEIQRDIFEMHSKGFKAKFLLNLI